MVTQIDHIEIIVNDVEEYEKFFTALGFNVVKRSNHHEGSVEFQLPGENQPIFEIHKVLMEEVIGINHIALRVDDVNETYELFKEKNWKIIGAPKFSAHTGRTNMNGRDPDGWRVQICDKTRTEPTE